MKIDLSLFKEYGALLIGPALKLAGVPDAYVPIAEAAITRAEQFSAGFTGAQKKAYAMDLVGFGLDAISVGHPSALVGASRQAVVDAVSLGIDAAVTAVNAFYAVKAAASNTGAGVSPSTK